MGRYDFPRETGGAESKEVGALYVAGEEVGEVELAELAHALEVAASDIPAPPDRIERARSRVLAAATAMPSVGIPRWVYRVAGVAAAAVLAMGIGGMTAAASDASPGSPLWSLRAAGWNLRLAFSGEDRQAQLLVEQASELAEMVEAAVRGCDTKGAEVARHEALSRLDRARRYVEAGKSDPVVSDFEIARIEEKLAELQSRAAAACYGEGSTASGPKATVDESGAGPTSGANGSSEPASSPSPGGKPDSKETPAKESSSGQRSREPRDPSTGPAKPFEDATPKGGRPEGKGSQPYGIGQQQRPEGGGGGRP